MRGPLELMSDKDSGDTPPEDEMQNMIGKHLRNLYDTVLVEPIPDRIVDLLMKLDDGAAEQEPANRTSEEEAHNDNFTERK